MTLQGPLRRIIYVTLFEAIAITICSAAFATLGGASLPVAGALSVACSIIAVTWNMIFTMAFEAWESRQAVRGRSVMRRIAHATLFEAGLVLVLVPLIAWWLDLGLIHALVMNLGISAFFLVYAFVFNWCFDHVFGLPLSAQARPVPVASEQSRG